MRFTHQPKVCIAGKNSIAIHGLRIAIEHFGSDAVVVCPNKTDNGYSNWQPSLIRYAKEFNVKITSLNEVLTCKDICFLSLEFDQIINTSSFKSKRLYNIHFSKLPMYKGVYTSAWPILNDESESGVTLHKIDDGIDTGEIISQVCFPLNKELTARDLYYMYLEFSKTLLDENIDKIFYNKFVESYPQSSYASSYYGLNSIKYSQINIDLKKTAYDVKKQIRAFSFREFQVPSINNFPIAKSIISNSRSIKKAGTLYLKNEEELILSTIDYDLILYRDNSLTLFETVKNNDTSSLEKIINKNSDINITDSEGRTLLAYACYNGFYDIARTLLTFGANPNATNQNGTTALMYAKDFCEKNNDFSLMNLLIESTALPSQKDFFGKTVLDYAKMNNQRKTINFIESLL